MGKLITLNTDQKEFIAFLERKIESNMEFYVGKYSSSALSELKYLVDEGFYSTLANAIAEDMFFLAAIWMI